MDDFLMKLWSLDSESNWEAEEVQDPTAARTRFNAYMADILETIRDNIPGIDRGYAAVTGIDHGFFTPIAAFGRDLSALTKTPTTNGQTSFSQYLYKPDTFHLILNPPTTVSSDGRRVRENLFIKLISYDEFYGFFSLGSYSAGVFTEDVCKKLKDIMPLLSRTIGSTVFSMRLRELSSPFVLPAGQEDESSLYEQIVQLTASGFGADGAVLRLYDPEAGLLSVVDFCGEVESELLVARKPGEGVCGRVFSGGGRSFAIGGPDKRHPIALEIPKADNERMRCKGIATYAVMCLTSEVTSPPEKSVLGTLSFFHRRLQRTSWRDIALFASFCQRVADTLALHRRTIDLHKRTDELQAIADNLRRQNMTQNQVEIVYLLAHDLGHRAFAACKNVDDYIKRCRTAMNDRKTQRTHEHLEDYAQRALESTLYFQSALEQIKRLREANIEEIEKPTTFAIVKVVDMVKETLEGGLKRNGVDLECRLPANLVVTGQKAVLEQILFNLVINSIDATRESKRRRNTIHIHGHKQGSGSNEKVVIQFWDDGPGISRQHFQDLNDIFEIGRTTKPKGTGMGLPVSRNLLQQYFSGQLELKGAGDARFQLTIPTSLKGKLRKVK